MNPLTRVLLASSVAGLALVAVVGALASGPDRAFCTKAAPIMRKYVGGRNPLKVFPFQNGTWCAFSSDGPYAEKFPTTAAKFKASAGGGKPVPGLGVPAYFAPGGNRYFTVSALKGSTELVVGAKSTEQKIVAATKALLPLVH